MILRLVDHQVGAIPERVVFTGAPWEQLERLAAVIGVPEWLVDVVLVSDEVMAGLNQQYRQVVGVTDVLSFSYLLVAGAGSCDLVGGEAWAASDLWCDPMAPAEAVGELVITPDFVARRCAQQGWPLAEEIPWLVVHGCLHLVGWDHQKNDERLAMLKAETEILAAEKLLHPLRQRS